MVNPFATDKMSLGYATSRPPVHPLVLGRAAEFLDTGGRVLDVGCGSGLSTKALEGYANEIVGIEPAEAMVRIAGHVAANGSFVVGRAEMLPFRDQFFDWLTAAGSLNYVHLPSFFSEARRVLKPKGSVAVYDFSPGRTMESGPELDAWFDRFTERYPWRKSEALDLDPDRLSQAGEGFTVSASEHFKVGVELTRDFYCEYMMTESNVAYALRRGVDESEIRNWVQGSLPEKGWGTVFFRGYWAIMRLWN